MGKIGILMKAVWNRLTMNENITARIVYSIKRQWPKVHRNDDCPCGSRKKYKQCCMGKTRITRRERDAWYRNLISTKLN